MPALVLLGIAELTLSRPDEARQLFQQALAVDLQLRVDTLAALHSFLLATFEEARLSAASAASRGALGGLGGAAAQVGGTWSVTVNSPQGAQSMTMTLTQDGTAFSGTMTSEISTLPVADGQVAGISVSWSITIPMGGQSMTVNFRGELEGTRIRGTAELGAFGSVPFTAEQQPAAIAHDSLPPDVYPERVMDIRPERISCAPARYPDELRRARIQGQVLLRFVIDTRGRAEPSSLRVLRTDHPGFVEPAREVVLGCSFRPGELHGSRVRVQITMPITFAVVVVPGRAPRR